MKLISLESCPVCRFTDFSEYLSCIDFFTTKEVFSLCKCKNCGFVFTDKFPSEDQIGRYYEASDYISHSNTKKGVVNSIYHFARQYMLSKKCDIVQRISGLKMGSILDYGCGTGYFLDTISKKGWRTQGIEKSKIGRDFAFKEFGLEVLDTNSLQQIEADSFDVITLWHVLEHIQDLNVLLTELKRILKPEGRLILALPNSASFDANYYKEYWAAYDVPRHLWHFTPATLELLAQNHKLELIEKQGMPLDAFYISMLSEKNKGNRFSFIRGMFIGIAAYISSLTDISKQSSVIYILKKL